MSKKKLEKKVRKYSKLNHIFKLLFIYIVEDRIKLYDEPKFDEEGNLIKDSLSEEEKSRKLQISLNNDVLITNCGVPIIFVVNKTDSPFQKYENKSEFILRHARKSAINYGATVVYTSTKSNFNITVLYDYIFHILLNFDLVHKSNLIDKTSFFIPSGYDRLSVLKSNDAQHDLDSEYTDVIKEEKEEEVIEQEVQCDKLSDFLKKIKDRVYRSRKSMIRDDIKFGKSLVPGFNPEMFKKKDENKEIKEEENTNANAEKVNKFQKFMEKKDANPEEGGEKKETLSKEERAKITKQNLLNKLRLSKAGK